MHHPQWRIIVFQQGLSKVASAISGRRRLRARRYHSMSEDAYILTFSTRPDLYGQVRCITMSCNDIMCSPEPF